MPIRPPQPTNDEERPNNDKWSEYFTKNEMSQDNSDHRYQKNIIISNDDS